MSKTLHIQLYSIIRFESGCKIDKSYYPEVLFKERKYMVKDKEIKRFIADSDSKRYNNYVWILFQELIKLDL